METKSTVYSLILLLCTLSFQASAQSESYKKNWKSLSKENAYNREPDWLKDAKFWYISALGCIFCASLLV